MMKLSEVFQEAIDSKTLQIKGLLRDEIGYCALGWLKQNGFSIEDDSRVGRWEKWLEKQYLDKGRGFPLRPIARLNDEKKWTWQRFRLAALKFERTQH